jgi:hypothetical protein
LEKLARPKRPKIDNHPKLPDEVFDGEGLFSASLISRSTITGS